jgi:hypothetical protein
MDQYASAPIQKRQRAGSISSRLRAASDLEEHGVIDKYQKGVFKDLIISGDSAMASALEKYEQGGDMSDIQGMLLYVCMYVWREGCVCMYVGMYVGR